MLLVTAVKLPRKPWKHIPLGKKKFAVRMNNGCFCGRSWILSGWEESGGGGVIQGPSHTPGGPFFFCYLRSQLPLLCLSCDLLKKPRLLKKKPLRSTKKTSEAHCFYLSHFSPPAPAVCPVQTVIRHLKFPTLLQIRGTTHGWVALGVFELM